MVGRGRRAGLFVNSAMMDDAVVARMMASVMAHPVMPAASMMRRRRRRLVFLMPARILGGRGGGAECGGDHRSEGESFHGVLLIRAPREDPPESPAHA
jgi:hypothetical protein